MKVSVCLGVDVSAYGNLDVDLPVKIEDGQLVAVDEACLANVLKDLGRKLSEGEVTMPQFEPQWGDAEYGHRIIGIDSGTKENRFSLEVSQNLDTNPLEAGIALYNAASWTMISHSEPSENADLRAVSNFRAALRLMNVSQEDELRLARIIALGYGYREPEKD